MTPPGAKTLHPPTVAMPGVWPYVVENQLAVLPKDEVELIHEIEAADKAIMMGSPDEAALLGWICELIGAKKVIEIGVFRGSTTLRLARCVGKDGKVVALDITDEYAQMGRKYWKQAGVEDRIDFRMGSAMESLDKMVDEESELGSYDLVFIDADKVSYEGYYERALKLVRKGGVIALDNVLWHGHVLEEESIQSEDTKMLVKMTKKLQTDERVSCNLVAIADGVTLCRVL